MPAQPYLPDGLYRLVPGKEQAEVYRSSPQISSEVRVRWLPDDPAHAPLNHLLAHISVLELDHLALAAARGEAYSVSKLTELLPRPGWDIETRATDNPAEYSLQQKGTPAIQRGPRRELLLLLELAARSALAPHIGYPPQHPWVQRLRQAHPLLIEALGAEGLFEPIDRE